MQKGKKILTNIKILTMINSVEKSGKKVYAVLDIGTTKIVYMVAEQNGNEVRILRHSMVVSNGVRRGDIVNVDETTRKIKEVIGNVENFLDVKPKEVLVGIAGFNIDTKIISANLALDPSKPINDETVKRLEEEIRIAAYDPDVMELLDYFPKDYIIKDINGKDASTLSPVGLFGKKLTGNYHVVVVKKTIKKHIENCIKNNGKEIKGYILEPVASAESTLNDSEKEVGALMVDIGGGTSDLIAYKDNKIIYTAVNPVGGVEITQAIKKVFGISGDMADKLKHKYGSCMPSKVKDKTEYINLEEQPSQLPKATINVLELARNIASVVKTRIISPLLGSLRNESIKITDFQSVVLTGGGSQLKDMEDFTGILMTLPARKGNVASEYKVGDVTIYVDKNLENPKYATVVGMLIYAVKKGLEVEFDIALKEPVTVEAEKEGKNNKDDGKKKSGFTGGSLWDKLKKVKDVFTDLAGDVE